MKELGAFLSEDVANRQLEFELSLWLSTLIDQERNVGAIQMTKDRFSEVSFMVINAAQGGHAVHI
jgi:hypothetical protein